MPKINLGSVHVPHHKNTATMVTEKMPVPNFVVLQMAQHLGAPCKPLVNVGDEVKVGQKIGENTDDFLTSPIFSSVSGKVVDMVDIITVNGVVNKAILIETDKLQTKDPSIKKPVINNHQDFVKAIRECGLVGLGGAGFPTNIKLNPKNLDDIDTLVINAAECEPYITCDTRLMIERTEEIIDGIHIVQKYLNIPKCIIAVEDNKPEAIKKLNEYCNSESSITVFPMKANYPKGAEKVIIYETTGRIVSAGKLPADVGVIVLNTSTVCNISEYLKTGMPLISKILTVDGSAIAHPKNVIVPIGTKIEDIIEFCGGYSCPPAKILMGGPMMGVAVVDSSYPIVKNNNAILAFGADEADIKPETSCIRCGRCVRACPFHLMPAYIDKAFHQKNIEELNRLQVNLCMECGCCSYVCPAKRHLVMYNKLAKKLLRSQPKK